MNDSRSRVTWSLSRSFFRNALITDSHAIWVSFKCTHCWRYYVSIDTFRNINIHVHISLSSVFETRLLNMGLYLLMTDKAVARVMPKISLDVLIRVENINESGVEPLAQRQKWKVWPCSVYREQYAETNWKFLQKLLTQKFTVQRRNGVRCVETTTPLRADSRLMFRKKRRRPPPRFKECLRCAENPNASSLP